LMTLTRPVCSLANTSSCGANALHGPHHVAKKSTKTGVGPEMSSPKDPVAMLRDDLKVT
jgi:hypothetical protein